MRTHSGKRKGIAKIHAIPSTIQNAPHRNDKYRSLLIAFSFIRPQPKRNVIIWWWYIPQVRASLPKMRPESYQLSGFMFRPQIFLQKEWNQVMRQCNPGCFLPGLKLNYRKTKPDIYKYIFGYPFFWKAQWPTKKITISVWFSSWYTEKYFNNIDSDGHLFWIQYCILHFICHTNLPDFNIVVTRASAKRHISPSDRNLKWCMLKYLGNAPAKVVVCIYFENMYVQYIFFF